MKKLFIFLIISIALLATFGCSKEDSLLEEEVVQLSFCAKVPRPIGTRASDELTVNTVYCAVYENDVELRTLRTKIKIVPGEDIIFSPRLIKSRTYKVVFWACNEGAYDVEYMEKITRNAPNDYNGLLDKDYDAFTFSTEYFTVGSNTATKTVILTRPFAQLNLGITESEWNFVRDTFGLIPYTIKILVDGVKTEYNAFIQEPVGVPSYTKEDEFILKCSGEKFTCTVDGTDKEFKRLGMCYVLLGAIDKPHLTYTVYDKDSNGKLIEIVKNLNISEIAMKTNYKTNVVGNLLTGTVNYNITISDELQ